MSRLQRSMLRILLIKHGLLPEIGWGGRCQFRSISRPQILSPQRQAFVARAQIRNLHEKEAFFQQHAVLSVIVWVVDCWCMIVIVVIAIMIVIVAPGKNKCCHGDQKNTSQAFG
jgi:hypothetical protein